MQKKKETVQFNVFVLNEMFKVYFSFFIKCAVSFFCILSPVALCCVCLTYLFVLSFNYFKLSFKSALLILYNV